MVAKANLSWEDFMPALQFAYNTSYQSSLASLPFQLLYGYKPSLPKSSSEANSVPVTFAQERLHIFKGAKNLLIDERRQEAQVQNDQLDDFILGQEIMLSKTSFGQQYWSGPGKIIEIKKKKVRVRLANKEHDFPPPSPSTPDRLC